MGALAWHTGGVMLDERWLRLLGGVSSAGLPDIASASRLEPEAADAPPYLVVAHDVVGGRFAVNGGGLPGDPGEVAYFGPDTLEWLPLGQSYSDFVLWALTGDTAAFYADLRWSGWERESRATPPASLLSSYPPLFTAQAHRGQARVSRRPVPWQEAVAFQQDVARQLADVPEGDEFTLLVDPHKSRHRWRR